MIIDYLWFSDVEAAADLDPQLIQNWYHFKEVRQNWLGFTADGNGGHALETGFPTALHESPEACSATSVTRRSRSPATSRARPWR